MGATQIDAGEFRAKQRQDWETASKGWREWNEKIDASTRHVAGRLVELAGIKAGDRVLDVAAGYGEPSLTAAKVVGPEGRVVATDISAGMLAFGRERAASAGVENIEFVESDASSLDYPAESFDAVVSRWGIIFEPEGEAVAAKVRGFLVPGSKMAISSWGPPERSPMIAVPMMAALQHLNVPPPPPGTPGPLSRPTHEAIGGLLEGGGLTDVQVEELNVDFEWDSPEEFARYTHDIVAPITALVEQHPPEVQTETWTKIAEAGSQHADADGRIRMSNLVLLAVGRA
jgi:ubiquinone/menaquinone biosynthesis C-methylase UbiE